MGGGAERPERQGACVEAHLLDYVQRLGKHRARRRAIHLHLSRLKDYNRQPHHLRIVASTLEPLARAHDGALFKLGSGDMLVVCNGATLAQMGEPILRLRYLFGVDPLLTRREDDDGFCSWYDLEEDYERLRALAEELAIDAGSRSMAEGVAKRQPPSTPLDPRRLAAVAAAIAQADLSSMMRRQAVCAVAQNAKPQPIFHEIYTSIHLLQTVLLPDCDIHGNPWLFQDLTRHLDRRMIAGLTKNDDATLKKAFSLNFNIATLLSPDFLTFDRALNSEARRTIVIEVQLIDLLADMGGFLFAREFLRERGYRLCLDGTTHHSLPFADRARLGFDLVKLQWSPELADQLAGSGGEQLSRAVKLNDPGRIIMTRCDSPEALTTGRKLGINIYQGYHLDRLLRQKTTSNEFIATLSKAMQRHRASQREAGRA